MRRDPEIVSEQHRRLGKLNWYPREEDLAIKDLTEAMDSADTDAILFVAVNLWIEKNADCPKPSELRALIREHNEIRARTMPTPAPTKRAFSCQECEDSGITGGTFKPVSQKGADQYEPAAWCKCPAAAGRQAEDPDAVEGINAINKRLADLNFGHRIGRRGEFVPVGQTKPIPKPLPTTRASKIIEETASERGEV